MEHGGFLYNHRVIRSRLHFGEFRTHQPRAAGSPQRYSLEKGAKGLPANHLRIKGKGWAGNILGYPKPVDFNTTTVL